MRYSGAGGSLGASQPAVWAIRNVVAPVHRWIYRCSRGRVLARNILLLSTEGCRTGKVHTNPVFFLRDSDQFVICNVRPRNERTNPWVLNLRAHPTATVQIGADRITCDAHELEDAQVDRYWPRLVALWPAYREHYERSGDRTVFVLEPRV
ncbi:nitroreductase/quinone reductase family protein [Mycolicibacterium aichiense]|uniref:nitroreductase/quinone reductase family protein n=1 Tax=Mycolicibacterium aichiense TaxID=1799 RepID=UPI000E0800D0|nr:nitroreductase/quinone reductase family protein [Mycolicibacterium aichiense]MCV7019211.1 nitroreductase family deazaflavin-dependent oxidoreductase [Mycolicibacterium aichiense]STZ24298.1 cytochrome C [Mycolicibacterium aichiense]